MARLVDLLDPDRDVLASSLPVEVHDATIASLLAPVVHDDEPRPRIEGRGSYIFAVFVVPVCVDEEDLVYFQELDLVITHDAVLAIRKTPEHGRPFDLGDVPREAPPGGIGAAIADAVAEAFLTAVDALDIEVD